MLHRRIAHSAVDLPSVDTGRAVGDWGIELRDRLFRKLSVAVVRSRVVAFRCADRACGRRVSEPVAPHNGRERSTVERASQQPNQAMNLMVVFDARRLSPLR